MCFKSDKGEIVVWLLLCLWAFMIGHACGKADLALERSEELKAELRAKP